VRTAFPGMLLNT